jgi:hypothetical protein
MPLHPGRGIGNNRRDRLSCLGLAGDRRAVPTLFRFVAVLAILGGLVFGGMLALVTFVTPEPREMIEVVPPAKLQPK